MVKLSYLKRAVDEYLSTHGDKQLISVGSCQSGTTEYILHLIDVHDGPIETNPFAGRDEIHLLREPAEPASPPIPDRIETYQELETELCKIARATLSVMERTGTVTTDEANTLWTNFTVKLMQLGSP